MTMSNTTAKGFAQLCGITESCARGQLIAFVAKGVARAAQAPNAVGSACAVAP